VFFHCLRYFLITTLLTIIAQAHQLTIADKNTARALDAMPEGVESMMVAKGPNIILDLPFVQCPDLEQLLQLCSNGKLAILTTELKGQDMLSSVSFAMNDHKRLYVSFLHPDRARERKLDDGLKKSCSQQCYIGGKLVCTDYDGFMICHVDRGVYVATDRKDVLEKFIARWQQPWIGRVAFSGLSVPLQYVAQDARFWGYTRNQTVGWLTVLAKMILNHGRR
jgi:hypothetical protein